MSRSWGHLIGPLPRGLLAEAQRDGERAAFHPGLKKPWPWEWRGLKCSVGRCKNPGVYAMSYCYVTGRAGRTTDARKRACAEHGKAFAAKNNIHLSEPAVTEAEVIAAYEGTGMKWGATA